MNNKGENIMSLTLQRLTEPSDLLRSAIYSFEEWRTTRKNRGPIPDKLWLTVQPLLPHYSINQIAKALRLNSTQLKEHCTLPTNTQSADPFIECMQAFSHDSMPKLDEPEHYTLEFDCKHASQVKIRGLNQDLLKQIVHVLSGVMPCCN